MKKNLLFCAIGEAMIELRHESEKKLVMGFAGDTLNVATYLARLAEHHQSEVHYITMLGNDPYSSQMIAQLESDNIRTEHIKILDNKLPGLYLIRTNSTNGERQFFFYRSQSAAREMFTEEHAKQMHDVLLKMDFIYLSAITLAILSDAQRSELFSILTIAKQKNIQIVFDSNYRPALWLNNTTTQNTLRHFMNCISIALPTFEDERAIFSDTQLEECIKRWRDAGVSEIVIKRGPEDCIVVFDEQIERVPAEKVTKIIDTTSAGDSFNAGYLAARMQGFDPIKAAKYGHLLASVVIQHPGAIIPKEKMPVLFF